MIEGSQGGPFETHVSGRGAATAGDRNVRGPVLIYITETEGFIDLERERERERQRERETEPRQKWRQRETERGAHFVKFVCSCYQISLSTAGESTVQPSSIQHICMAKR